MKLVREEDVMKTDDGPLFCGRATDHRGPYQHGLFMQLTVRVSDNSVIVSLYTIRGPVHTRRHNLEWRYHRNDIVPSPYPQIVPYFSACQKEGVIIRFSTK